MIMLFIQLHLTLNIVIFIYQDSSFPRSLPNLGDFQICIQIKENNTEWYRISFYR